VLPAGFDQKVIDSEPNFPDLPDMNQQNEDAIKMPTVLASQTNGGSGGNHDNDDRGDDKRGKHNDNDNHGSKKQAEAGRLLFRTHETNTDGAVSVTDLKTGKTAILSQQPHWQRFDGLKWTPWDTLLAAEETSNVAPALRDPAAPNSIQGLVYEIDPVTGTYVPRPALGSLAHEGIGIDKKQNIYVIDEFATGGIFKFVPDYKGDLSAGTLYVLKITTPTGDRTGQGQWIQLDRNAVQIDARAAAAAAGATGYGRPEDVEVVGDTLYVAITSEHRVIAITLKGDPVVTDFVKAGLNVPVEVDTDGGSDEQTGFNSPDNLASDESGNLFIAEDNTPGDIWMAKADKNKDGQSDGVVLFASLSDCEAEPTGILFGIAKQTMSFFVDVQHATDVDKSMVITKH
jgi:secreted PhoX family phosphatase